MNPYTTLNVEKTATPDQIKKAYRRRAAETHPDKPGGDEEAFKAVNAAHVLLSRPELRDRYDRTGEWGEANQMDPAEGMLLNKWQEALQRSLQINQPLDFNRFMFEGLTGIFNESKNRVTLGKKNLEKLRLHKLRIKVKEGVTNLLAEECEKLIQMGDGQVRGDEETVKVAKRALEMLAGYEFEREEIQVVNCDGSLWNPKARAFSWSAA